jgi:hypothetical protein
MRQIDADALKRRAQKVATESWKMGIKAKVETVLNQFIDWIDEAPTIQAEPHWIPMMKRLPKEDGNYLVSGKWGSGKESVGECEFSVEDGYFQTAWNFDVLAWMPLPEPYKGVKG